MSIPFWRSVQSEWLKGRRSLASALVVLGGLFVPAMLILVRIQQGTQADVADGALFWERVWRQAWESLAVLFLPLETIVLTALATHLEHRYNGWKQVRATAQSDAAIVGAKLLVVLVRLAQLFLLLLLGIWLAGAVPALAVHGALPAEPFPLRDFLLRAARYYLDLMPVVALQFLLGLRSRNVLVPVGVGVAGWTMAMVAMSWRYSWFLPYAYLPMDFLAGTTAGRVGRMLPAPLEVVALMAFALATLAAYASFATQRERG